MEQIKTRDIFLIAVMIIVLVNVVFYYYIAVPMIKKNSLAAENVKKLSQQLDNEINLFNIESTIFAALKNNHSEIKVLKQSLWQIRENLKTDEKIGEIIKTILIESGLTVTSFELSDIKKEGNTENLIFKGKVVGSPSATLKMLDNIENSDKPLEVISYTAKGVSEGFETEIEIKSVRVENPL